MKSGSARSNKWLVDAGVSVCFNDIIDDGVGQDSSGNAWPDSLSSWFYKINFGRHVAPDECVCVCAPWREQQKRPELRPDLRQQTAAGVQVWC